MGKRSSKSGAGGNGGGVAFAEKGRRVSESAANAGESAPGRRPTTTAGGARRGFFDIYKPGQGYHTRVGSGFVLGALVCWGSYALYEKLELLDNRTVQVFIPVGVIIAIGLAGYWALALKRSICDFLIATEGEMKKVNWTSRKEIIGSGGAMVIAAERDRWYIRIHGLEPCRGGCSYRVWFITEAGVVPSVQFDMDPARTEFEFTSTDVPQGLRAVSVTIEAVEGADEPTGQQVLIADQAMRLL